MHTYGALFARQLLWVCASAREPFHQSLVRPGYAAVAHSLPQPERHGMRTSGAGTQRLHVWLCASSCLRAYELGDAERDGRCARALPTPPPPPPTAPIPVEMPAQASSWCAWPPAL